ncbi:MAG: response regulator, partial [Magnetococcus sp. WYHC-3]
RIFIVDDTETNIDVLLETLGDKYDVSVALDGETALDGIPATQPDLVLLDVMMPGIDGYEVCRQLKADPATRGIPVIFITARQEVTDETRGFAVGAVDYITKPFSPPRGVGAGAHAFATGAHPAATGPS